MFSSRVSVEPQYGQRKTADWSCTSVGALASRGAGGAKPAARSFSRPSAEMQSVDHESSAITAISGSPPSDAIFGDVADHAEVDERDDRDLGIRDLGERVPDLLARHHVAPGTLRRTIVISSQSW